MPNFGYKVIILILTGTLLTLWFRGNIQIGNESNLNQVFSKKEPTPAQPSLNEKETEKNTKVIVKEVSKSVLKVIMMAKLEQILNLE